MDISSIGIAFLVCSGPSPPDNNNNYDNKNIDLFETLIVYLSKGDETRKCENPFRRHTVSSQFIGLTRK